MGLIFITLYSMNCFKGSFFLRTRMVYQYIQVATQRGLQLVFVAANSFTVLSSDIHIQLACFSTFFSAYLVHI